MCKLVYCTCVDVDVGLTQWLLLCGVELKPGLNYPVTRWCTNSSDLFMVRELHFHSVSVDNQQISCERFLSDIFDTRYRPAKVDRLEFAGPSTNLPASLSSRLQNMFIPVVFDHTTAPVLDRLRCQRSPGSMHHFGFHIINRRE